MNYKKLSELLEENDKIPFTNDIWPSTLAKAAYWWWCEQTGWEPWFDASIRLYGAIDIMLKFISDKFEGGEEWTRMSAVVDPDSPGHDLWLSLETTGKFSMASRYLMDFVVRGEAKMVRRRKGIEWKKWTQEELDLQ